MLADRTLHCLLSVPVFSALLFTTVVASANEGLTPVVCEPHQVTTEFLAARRTSPGEISVDIAYEHASNFPYQLNAAGGVALIDSNGEQWESADKGNNLSKIGKMSAGIKYKHTYKFFKRVGGGDVSTINFTNRFRVWQGSKLLGACDFEAKGVALKWVDPRMRPNPSLERTSTGLALGPRTGQRHHPLRGPSTNPVVSAQLKR